VKKAMDSFPQFETPAHLVRRESKCVKHQPMFTVEVALRLSVWEGFDLDWPARMAGVALGHSAAAIASHSARAK